MAEKWTADAEEYAVAELAPALEPAPITGTPGPQLALEGPTAVGLPGPAATPHMNDTAELTATPHAQMTTTPLTAPLQPAAALAPVTAPTLAGGLSSGCPQPQSGPVLAVLAPLWLCGDSGKILLACGIFRWTRPAHVAGWG